MVVTKFGPKPVYDIDLCVCQALKKKSIRESAFSGVRGEDMSPDRKVETIWDCQPGPWLAIGRGVSAS